MKRIVLVLSFLSISFGLFSQPAMTPELLWKLGRVTAIAVTPDGKQVVYSVSMPDVAADNSTKKYFSIPLGGGQPTEIMATSNLIPDKSISPDRKYQITPGEVKLLKVFGKDFYPDLGKSNVQIYEDLNYRHWDTWEDGAYSHLFVHALENGHRDAGKDIMEGELFDCPQKPFGGEEDYVWTPDSQKIIYVSKKRTGKAYALSTNTDLYAYDLTTGITANLTDDREGYDTEPAFSSGGQLAWLSMKREGYESDKNDLIVRHDNVTTNLTQQWDGSVTHFRWSQDGTKIFFVAAVDGTTQLFEVDDPGRTKKIPVVRQVTKGDFDITGITGQAGPTVAVTRTDMNHATEVFAVNLANGAMTQLTHVNDAVYQNIGLSKTERRMVTTTDGKQMLVWVIYPPDFDPAKKYPTLLYCQGGPQSALTQFYSFRWNFQLMAANGYIIVAPNRRGMPGHGVAWNEEISKDHGGQAMDDYLSAIDAVAKEPYVDKNRLGCIGASYGGYSVFYLAGIHNHRFKTFISHDGIFDFRSMYGTTEELFFVNWDYGGPYWEKNNAAAQKSFIHFDPSNLVDQWDTPILIFQGGKDYRVPDGQGFEAFQAAQLKGIKSRLVYLPTENHWVTSAQNAQVWQREFFRWLKETL